MHAADVALYSARQHRRARLHQVDRQKPPSADRRLDGAIHRIGDVVDREANQMIVPRNANAVPDCCVEGRYEILLRTATLGIIRLDSFLIRQLWLPVKSE